MQEVISRGSHIVERLTGQEIATNGLDTVATVQDILRELRLQQRQGGAWHLSTCCNPMQRQRESLRGCSKDRPLGLCSSLLGLVHPLASYDT